MQPHRHLRGSIRPGVAVPLVAVAIAAITVVTPADADPGPAMPVSTRGTGSTAPPARAGIDLGLGVSPASDVLREQLALAAGTGLVVDTVVEGSIAARAGIRRHDVLVSLDDRPLVAVSQMAGLLEPSGREPPLRCQVVRGGSSLAFRLPVRLPPGWARGDLQAASRDAGQQRPAVRGRVGLMMRVADETLMQQDPDFHIKVTTGAETRLFVRDARGLTVYNGPIDTPEQRSLVPIAVRDRVERMERLLAAPATGHGAVAHLSSAPTAGERGAARTGSARPVAHESNAARVPSERTASRAEPRQADAGAAETVRDRRPVDGDAPVIEIGRLDIEPVEIR